MSFNQAEAYVIGSYRRGAKHKLPLLYAALEFLGNPQDNIKVIHVAGTNGKGTACAMLSSVLRRAGYKTGMFTSPHLESFKERFRINGAEITEAAFADLAGRVKYAGETLFGETFPGFSYFELLTIMAFCWFNDERVDFAVVEVGLGGRLDATNVVKAPLLSVIASISLDHTEFLGDSIEKIAAEKGGIIKKNCPAVLYSQKETVYNVIKVIADSRGSHLFYDRNRRVGILSDSYKGISFSVKSELLDYDRVDLGLSGDYQIDNAMLVLTAFKALSQAHGISISEGDILGGIAETVWPGRFEILSENPLFIVDGAHNIDAVEIFAASARKYFSRNNITLITAMLRDKPYEAMMRVLSGIAGRLVITKPAYAVRAAEPYELYAAISGEDKTIIAEGDYRRAVDIALGLNGENGVILCCGSLYLVGGVREYMITKTGRAVK
jgi:dihydrofolate synthase/folylpolyglutamate synthase